MVKISAQLVVEGALTFRVKSGLVECMGLVVGAPATSERAKSSQDQWVRLVSGDALRRTN